MEKNMRIDLFERLGTCLEMLEFFDDRKWKFIMTMLSQKSLSFWNENVLKFEELSNKLDCEERREINRGILCEMIKEWKNCTHFELIETYRLWFNLNKKEDIYFLK
jgi:hypothetical protein